MRAFLAAAVLLWSAGVAHADVRPCTDVPADAICHEAVLPAEPETVWGLFGTTEGLKSWLAPVASIDLRVGGLWEASYDPAARPGDPGNIHNRVLSFLPGRMLSIAIDRAPPGFPHADLARTLWTVMEFAPEGEGTRMRVTMLGFGAGDGYATLRRHFERGNAFTLTSVEARLANGPTDWATRLRPPGNAKGKE